ncbi:MAG: GMC family oxidoreductase [Acidimicrobiales bacterium]|nr:GMC family oxidoreductase [Acidimicrobiales bacterium]
MRTEEALAQFCAALLPPEHGGPEPAELAERVVRHLDHVPALTRYAVKAGATALALTGRLVLRQSIRDAPPEQRVALLDRLAYNDRVALALDGMKSLVLLAFGADTHAAEMVARSTATPPAHPDADLTVISSTWWPSHTHADAVVIGSGAGGAMAARRLAHAGLDVVVVEEGRRWTVDEFRTRHPHERYAELYRDGGTTIAIGSPAIVLPIGRGVGGTTLVNSGTCYRPPLSVQRRWRDEFGFDLADPPRLLTYLDEVEELLQVAPVPLETMGRNGQLLLEGAAKLGWSASPIPRNAPGCAGSCQCAIGCPRNAKYGVHLNALPDACRHGARILTDARALRIIHERRRARGVIARRPDGSSVTLRAPIIVVAAGATETPGLLRRSHLGEHPELGRNLSLHPALGVAGRFEERIVSWQGVLQSAAIDEFHRSNGILVEATATPPGMGSMILPGFGRNLLRQIEDADHLAVFGAMIADQPAGRVQSLGPHTLIRYDLDRGDGRRLFDAIRVMGRVMFAAGAVEVLSGVPGEPAARSQQQLEDQLARADIRKMHLAAFHPTGTARAGADPDRSPVAPDGTLRGVSGVWVADASVLPSCPEVNPQVSIMAVALSIADGIVNRG